MAAPRPNVFVVLSDWRGHAVWSSLPPTEYQVGQFVWENLTPASQAATKLAHAEVASLRQSRNLIVVRQDGRHFRCWLWPLDTPQMAVCTLCRDVPAELSEFTDREMECLQLLAQGLLTRDIADRLEMSTSTLHSHLSNVRAKLNLDNLEALISFAARYCFPQNVPFKAEE
jgi:DNA-binding CsgD family transcriptional regulator